ncbi:MAG: hypothetical protein HQ494_00660 [Rhodospirillales bacterium]|nr:hypothetical protein [Rhodospirillales bacterium]
MNTFTAIKSYIISVVLGAGLLGACAGVPYNQPGERTAELPTDKGVILFSAPDWDAAVRRVQYTDNEQRVDYALFRGRGEAGAAAQAEFIYMERPTMANVAFNFPFNVRDKAAAWNFSKGQAVEWGEAILTTIDIGTIYTQPYRLVAMDRQCFGLLGEWDNAVDDPDLRPTRILFGYYCAPTGVPLGEDKITSLAGGLGLRTMTRRAVVYAPFYKKTLSSEEFYRDITAHAGDDKDNIRAMGLAQGHGVLPVAGIAEFPFRYAQYYSMSEGDDRN